MSSNATIIPIHSGPEKACSSGEDQEEIKQEVLNNEDGGLQLIDVHGQDLHGVDFSAENLVGANFSNCNLRGCDFRRSLCDGANFNGSDLAGADFTGADMRGATFEGAYIEDGIKLLTDKQCSPLTVIGPIGLSGLVLCAYYTENGIYVRSGNFFGTLDQFEAAFLLSGENRLRGRAARAAILAIHTIASPLNY